MATANPYAQQAKKSKEALVLEYAPLVKRVVTRMAAKFPPEVNRDDMMQAGALGLIDAVEKFDESKGVPLKSYAEFRIRGAILDELRALDWIPRSVRSTATKIEQAQSSLSGQLGRDPSDKEMAKHMDVSLKEYQQMLDKSRPIPLLSIDDLKSADNPEATSLLDVLEDPDVDDPYETLEFQEMRSALAEAIDELPEQEKMVLVLHAQEELNLKEIGAVLNISESRASQVRTKAILKLRSKLREKY